MLEKGVEFKESHRLVSRADLLKSRIGDLRLQLHGTRLERLVQRLYAELQQAGLQFQPPVYLSDDWGCPDRVPIIGVPFYLADAELTRLEDDLMEGVEAETDHQVMRYLRHEAGHAFNYAYRLYETPEWTNLFGPFSRPYPDDYTPNPFSRSFVRHLPAWYAQKHPDEDFAETFAVWLDPDSRWEEVYAEWACLPKLQYCADMAKITAARPAPVTAENYDTREEFLLSTLEEHYQRSAPPPLRVAHMFDAALRDIFPVSKGGDTPGESAAAFLHRHRRMIISTVFYWTGLNDALVRSLVDHLEQRCAELQLQAGPDESARLIESVVLVTTLCMNRLLTGDFLAK